MTLPSRHSRNLSEISSTSTKWEFQDSNTPSRPSSGFWSKFILPLPKEFDYELVNEEEALPESLDTSEHLTSPRGLLNSHNNLKLPASKWILSSVALALILLTFNITKWWYGQEIEEFSKLKCNVPTYIYENYNATRVSSFAYYNLD